MTHEKPTEATTEKQGALHTPGPWRAEFSEYGGYDCMTSAWNVSAGDGIIPLTIATLDCGDYGQTRHDRDSRPPLAEANARLIAAAPDLLAAAKAVQETCPCDRDITARFDAAWQSLLDAIEKAEGR